MAAGVMSKCAAYYFVKNFATTEFPDSGCSKRDIVLSKSELKAKKRSGDVGHSWSSHGHDFALPPSKA